jgi:transposase-like protein
VWALPSIGVNAQPDPGRLRSWYLDDGLSVGEIARRVGLTPSTTRRRLIAAGVTLRTRREQVELQDRVAGRREPSGDELLVGYETERLTMEELAARYQITASRIRVLLIRYGITIRPSGKRGELIAAERELRRSARPVSRFVELHRAGWSATAIAEVTGSTRKQVSADLRHAGISKPTLPPIQQWVQRYTTGGETAAEIAATYGVTSSAVYRAMRHAGVDRRPAVVRHRHVDDTEIVTMYIDRQMTVAGVAAELGISLYLTRRALRRCDVDTRRRSSIDDERLAALYRDGLSFAAIATELGVSRTQVRTATRRLGLLPRPSGRHGELTVSTTALRKLIDAGVSDDEIAHRFHVAVWAVRRRRRREQLHRPVPRPAPPLSRRELHRLLESGVSLSEIASRHRVGLATVRRWRIVYDIDRPITGSSRGRRSDKGVDLDPVVLEQWYVDEHRTIAEIASYVDVDSAIVAFALHSHRIPVRRSRSSNGPGVIVLDALYDDVEIRTTLADHKVALRREGGWLRDRFGDPAPIDDALIVKLYQDIGLSTSHISLLTGHAAPVVQNHLRQSGVTLRRGSRSPWFSRTLTRP